MIIRELAWLAPLGLVVLVVLTVWALNHRDRRRMAKLGQLPIDGEPLEPGDRLEFIHLAWSYYSDESAP